VVREIENQACKAEKAQHILVHNPDMTSFLRPVCRTALQFLSSSKASKLGTFRAYTSWPGNRAVISEKKAPFDWGLMVEKPN
jgi:hypothetical protein